MRKHPIVIAIVAILLCSFRTAPPSPEVHITWLTWEQAQSAQKKTDSIKSKSPQDHRLKLMRFLMSKGFESKVIQQVLKAMKI